MRRGAAAGARGAGRRHLQRARGRGRARRAARCRRVVGLGLRPGRARSRPPRRTTRTPTTRSTARPRSSTRACCAASTRCTASTTSRCATSTSTGRGWTSTASTPRCSSAGWSASTAGKPPLIFGDGTQTMDFVYIGDIARANMLAAESRRHRRGLQRRQRHRDQPARARRDAAARSWAPTSTSSTAPSAPSTRCRAASPTRAPPREQLGFDGRGRPRGGPRAPRRVVARRARGATSRPRCGGGVTSIPIAKPLPRAATRAPRSPRRSLSGWVTQGPRVARVRARVRRARRRRRTRVAVTNCTTALHLALVRRRASAPATR